MLQVVWLLWSIHDRLAGGDGAEIPSPRSEWLADLVRMHRQEILEEQKAMNKFLAKGGRR